VEVGDLGDVGVPAPRDAFPVELPGVVVGVVDDAEVVVAGERRSERPRLPVDERPLVVEFDDGDGVVAGVFGVESREDAPELRLTEVALAGLRAVEREGELLWHECRGRGFPHPSGFGRQWLTPASGISPVACCVLSQMTRPIAVGAVGFVGAP
jgi:hypothetical protein